jgi:hypothetical protein
MINLSIACGHHSVISLASRRASRSRGADSKQASASRSSLSTQWDHRQNDSVQNTSEPLQTHQPTALTDLFKRSFGCGVTRRDCERAQFGWHLRIDVGNEVLI